MDRQQEEQEFIEVIEKFLAGKNTPQSFCDEAVSRWIHYRDAYMTTLPSFINEQTWKVYLAWQDGKMPELEFAAKWRAIGGSPYEEYFRRLINLVHSDCMRYDMGYDPEAGEIDENQMRQEVLEAFRAFEARRALQDI